MSGGLRADGIGDFRAEARRPLEDAGDKYDRQLSLFDRCLADLVSEVIHRMRKGGASAPPLISLDTYGLYGPKGPSNPGTIGGGAKAPPFRGRLEIALIKPTKN
ncbi:hypothetical protein SBA2_520016 [Acidobacteriia bacterium SbA2]|nr:hypothetical protein SBA2_520016 [Acidobacteriia bacterium SbA2]